MSAGPRFIRGTPNFCGTDRLAFIRRPRASRGAKAFGEASGAVNQAIGEAGSQARAVAGDMLATGRQTAQAVFRQFDEQPFLTVLAGFGLGYIAGLGRR